MSAGPLITITYTPEFSSDPINSNPFICHRICYRNDNAGEYCCVEDDTASVAGTPKTFDIDLGSSPAPCVFTIPPDPQSCIAVNFTGYVQACCEDINSISGRVGWTANFTPDPDCIGKLVCCQSELPISVSYLVITNPGAGYDDGLTPIGVTIIRDINDPVSAGGGNDAVITADISGGAIVGFNVTTAGLYGKIPLLVIPSPTLGGPVQATAIAVIPCIPAEFVPGQHSYLDCAENQYDITNGNVQGLPLLGECKIFCFPRTAPFIYDTESLPIPDSPDSTHFIYTSQGCCDCTSCGTYDITVSSILSTIDLYWEECSNPDDGDSTQQTQTIPGSGTVSISCMVPNSISCPSDNSAIVSVVRTGNCSSCIVT